MTDPLAVVAYLRVSTQGQADNGHGLDAQEAACRAYARMEGRDLVGVITERGVSGDRAERRRRRDLGLPSGPAGPRPRAAGDPAARDPRRGRRPAVRHAGRERAAARPSRPDPQADAPYPRRVRGVREVGDSSAAGGRPRRQARQRRKGLRVVPVRLVQGGQVEREQHVLSVIKTMLAQGQTLDVIAEYLNRRPGHQPRHAARWTRQTVGAVASKAGLTKRYTCSPTGRTAQDDRSGAGRIAHLQKNVPR